MTQWMKPCVKRKTCGIRLCDHSIRHEVGADCVDHHKDRVSGYCPKCVPEKKGGKVDPEWEAERREMSE